MKAAALELGLPVTDRRRRRPGARSGPTSAWSWRSAGIIKPHVLDALPMVNLHFSLLPAVAGRGAGRAGDPRRRRARPASASWTSRRASTPVGVYARGEVADRPGRDGRRAARPAGRRRAPSCWSTRCERARRAEPQAGEPTYADKLDADGARARLVRRPAVELHRLVRVGRAWTTFRGKRLKVWRTPRSRPTAASSPASWPAPGGTGAGTLELVEVQPEGKAAHAGGRLGQRRGPTRGDGDRRAREPTARRPAWRVDALVPHRREGAYANLVLPALLDRSGLDDRDRGLRHRARLRHHPHAAGAATSSSTGSCCATLDPPIRAALRLGAYQLTFLRHAAARRRVGHRSTRSPPARPAGLVNAVLRRVADAPAARLARRRRRG